MVVQSVLGQSWCCSVPHIFRHIIIKKLSLLQGAFFTLKCIQLLYKPGIKCILHNVINICVILCAYAGYKAVLCVFVCPASVLQAMAVLVCAEMYQVKRLQHLCEVCVCAYLQSMPSRELSSTGISVIRLLRRAKVSAFLSV